MTKIDAIIQPGKFETVKSALVEFGVEGMTVSEIRGYGRQKGHTAVFRGREYSVDLLPKIKIELVVDDSQVEGVMDTIASAASTGHIGDGKIFVYKIDDIMRIRNKERGVTAI